MTLDEDFSYPRESQEYLYFNEVIIDGGPPTVPLQAAMIRGLTQRPTDDDVEWFTVVNLGGSFGFLLPGDRDAGTYKIWVRALDLPKAVFIDAGSIRLT
jgi:hypothetical protein